MNLPKIKCPKCNTDIEISKVFANQIENTLEKQYSEKYELYKKEVEEKAADKMKKEYEKKYKQEVDDLKSQITEKEQTIKDLSERELKLNKKERELKTKEERIEKELAEKLEKEKESIEIKIRKRVEKEKSLEQKDLLSNIEDLQKRLNDAEANELKLRKMKRDLEEEKSKLTLEKERAIDAAKSEIYSKAKNESDLEYQLKIRERDEQLKQLNARIEELKKKSEQGSQQLQGEVQELELEEFLKLNFPIDQILPVKKGEKGADIIQIVKNEFGIECGKILWESKRHKNFDKKWIAKLKEDQRESKSNVGIIITQVLPEEINNFGLVDGVWVGNFFSTLGIAMALRESLMQINLIRQSEVGKNQKMESLYNYLISHEFSQRIEAIIEAFAFMKKQIDDERKVFEKQWSSRDKMLSQVIKNTSGMYGDLQGLIGASLPNIELLSLPPSAD